MTARIYRPARTAMQSGVANAQSWLLEYEPEVPRSVEPLMGWTSSADMQQQVRMRFDTLDEAKAYAEKNGIPYRVIVTHEAPPPILSYSDNFKFNRVGAWTH